MATLAEFYLGERDRIKTRVTTLKNDLYLKKSDVAQAKDDYSELRGELADIETEISDLRQQIAQALMPADAEELAEQLRQKQIEWRKKNAELISADIVLNNEIGLQEDLQSKLKRCETQLGLAETELEQANIRQARHEQWKSIVAGDSLTDLASRAQELLDQMDLSGATEDKEIITIRAAHQRLQDIPETLRLRAQARHNRIENSIDITHGLLQDIENEFGDYRDSNYGPGGEVEKLWVQFERNEKALGKFIQSAQLYYDNAVSLLKQIQVSDELTTAEQDRINDTDLASDSAAALTAEEDLNQKQQDVEEAMAARDVAIARAIIADPDANPASDADVIDANNTLNTAVGDRDTALATYEAEMENLDLWEAAIPNHIWQNLVFYDRAIALLNKLTSTSPATLVSDMESSQDDLKVALENESKILRSNEYLEDTMTMLNGRVQYVDDSRNTWVTSAVRGDN